ncbi:MULTISPECIES: GNAT family N-acetyltransferase [Chryseobacterium]|uniref:GNAT family N-acetyltransferase n=1 Tax=Chryseobacterium TaxID=59732 RepID=UPI001BE5D041|nr:MULTISPECIES: GNAT family N-acetyltransferase [Chryseobacterium]MBT2623477.1 GNAT family N-acetyltransferase [Chryseobacterium sp. ISL-6]
MNVNFSIFPALETERLNLRRLSLEDAQAIYELRSDHEVAKLTGREPANSISDATAYIQKIENLFNENSCIFWAISYKDQSALIGALCFWNFDLSNKSVEIGYELLPEFQKMGIMGEGLRAIINFGFENMGAETITAFPSAHNPSSVNILEKLNFKMVHDTFQHTHENIEGMLTYVLHHSEHSDSKSEF